MAKYQYNAPMHLNGEIFCAVDTETTGLDCEKHSIIEICVLPLNGDYSVNKSILPFTCQMQPIEGRIVDPEALRVNKIELSEIMLTCLDAFKVLDLFVEWFEKLNLGLHKGIVPIAQNWPFDRGFLVNWMGDLTFRTIFSRHYRDTMSLAASINDRCDIHNHPIQFPKLNLQSIANKFNIVNPDPHRALGDAWTTSQVYRQLLMTQV